MKEDRRTAKLEVRCTPLEKARVRERALAAGLKVSDYLRRRALCEPIPLPDARVVIPGQTTVDDQIEALAAVNGAEPLTEAGFKQAVNDEA